MLSDQFKIDRRSFIGTAAPLALVLSGLIRPSHFFARSGSDDAARVRQSLLKKVNRERRQNGLSALELDDLASRVAEAHARDMVDGLFLSHWGRNGQKPYHRYSFAGGTEAVQENAASADDVSTESVDEVEQTVLNLHQSMFDERPPDDGHRQTILFPHHTHVGFGVAVKPDHVRMVELYISRYAEVARLARTAARGALLNFSGRLLNPKHSLEGIYIHRDPLPQPPALAWLRTRRSYSLPESYESLWPRLSGGDLYSDGTRGTIEITNGHFRTLVPLFREPGINTIVIWIQRAKDEEPFPITQICVRCE